MRELGRWLIVVLIIVLGVFVTAGCERPKRSGASGKTWYQMCVEMCVEMCGTNKVKSFKRSWGEGTSCECMQSGRDK